MLQRTRDTAAQLRQIHARERGECVGMCRLPAAHQAQEDLLSAHERLMHALVLQGLGEPLEADNDTGRQLTPLGAAARSRSPRGSRGG